MAEFIGLAIQIFFVHKIFKPLNVIKMSNKYLISAIILFVVCVLINNIPLPSIYIIILQIILGSIVYFLSLLVLKEKFVVSLINTLKGKFVK